ncbi:MAG TPA: putative lipid II flippase FtsW [Pseudolysinimonas sp.]|nr:putative lipid II flippase FtsW [Pseudolysinimonas sp.]
MTTTRPPARSRNAPPPAPEPQPPRAAVIAVRKLFAAEAPEFFLLLGTTIFLVVFGLVMVLSSSSIESYVQSGDFFTTATHQGLYALIGVPIMLLASRAPISFWKRWARVAVFLGIGLQLLVFSPLGWSNGYNQNWIRIGSFTAQPSELIKLAFMVWLAWMLTARPQLLDDWKRILFSIGPIVGLSIGLVLFGSDLGTAVILISIALGALFFAGVKLRWIAGAVAVISVIALLLVQLSLSRSTRVAAWLGGCADPSKAQNECYQVTHGWQSLAHGGVFGVGLGNSTGKWSWVPEADNDFIFAIIGEELGLLGAILVLGLFVVLAICFVRIVRMSRDPFAKLATSAAMVWIIGQAFVNIAVVLGLLPVLGVPLPLVSAGGSALITTLAAIGVVLSFARHRPENVAIPGATGR